MSGGKAAGGALLGIAVIPILVVVAISGTAPTPAPVGGGGLNSAGIPADLVPLIQAAGTVCAGITAPDIAAQLKAESGFNRAATSPAGAQGIAQFMPGTWVTWGKDYDHNGSSSPLDPGDAIPAQAHFMCALYSQVTTLLKAGSVTGDPNDLAWAAYNAGLGAVQGAGGVPRNGETPAYITNIRKYLALFTAAGGVGGPALAAGASLSQTVLAYAWHTNQGQDHLAQMPQYTAAVNAARASGHFYAHQPGEYPAGRPEGDHCSATASLIATTAVDPSYNDAGVMAQGAGFVPVQEAWMAAHWQLVGSAGSLSLSQLRPGDVGISNGGGLTHVWMYVGSVPGFSGNFVEGSYAYSGHVGFAPQARQSPGVLYAGFPHAVYYRKK
ncbi:lytic transglycosylase domain-containing protein (plasmid) [Dermatophilaceae bacterium Sec6.4]